MNIRQSGANTVLTMNKSEVNNINNNNNANEYNGDYNQENGFAPICHTKILGNCNNKCRL